MRDPKGNLNSYGEIIGTESRSGETVLVEDERQNSAEGPRGRSPDIIRTHPTG